MTCKILVFLGCLFVAAVVWAEAPNFDYAYFISNQDGIIPDSNTYSIPELGDWDDDGDVDLMVGAYFKGTIYYYENVSTGTEPEFGPCQIVEADGSPISVSYG